MKKTVKLRNLPHASTVASDASHFGLKNVSELIIQETRIHKTVSRHPQLL